MLVLDGFRCDLIDFVKRRLPDSRPELAVILGGMTSQQQPIDVGLKKPLKHHVKHLYAHR